MISHSQGDAAYHRQERGIKTPEQNRIEELEAEVKRLKSTERFLRSERPMARKMTELEAELAECKRDDDALRQDSERLIWICDHFFESQWNGVLASGSKTHWQIAGDYRHTAAKMEGFYFREAIDAAIADMGEKK